MAFKVQIECETKMLQEINSQEHSEIEANVSTQSKGILSLNDDCLLEIFQYLQPLDLCAIKKSCKQRLGDLADK